MSKNLKFNLDYWSQLDKTIQSLLPSPLKPQLYSSPKSPTHTSSQLIPPIAHINSKLRTNISIFYIISVKLVIILFLTDLYIFYVNFFKPICFNLVSQKYIFMKLLVEHHWVYTNIIFACCMLFIGYLMQFCVIQYLIYKVLLCTQLLLYSQLNICAFQCRHLYSNILYLISTNFLQ